MPSKIVAYICKYTHHETLFPRHLWLELARKRGANPLVISSDQQPSEY